MRVLPPIRRDNLVFFLIHALLKGIKAIESTAFSGEGNGVELKINHVFGIARKSSRRGGS